MTQKKKKRPADINQLAASIIKDATEPEESEFQNALKSDEIEKNPAAVALGRLGGLKGGKARAEKLSSEKRKEIARKAARARWQKDK